METRRRRWAFWVQLAALSPLVAVLGCFHSVIVPNECGKLGNGGEPAAVKALIEKGTSYLGDREDYAAVCFARALQLAPDNFEANLRLGVAYVARARSEDANGQKSTSALALAKRFLGRAYMLRQGHFEPLYYLGEVAILENNSLAVELLDTVARSGGPKAGAAYTLLGYIAERKGDRQEAQENYRAAVTAGSSDETLEYLEAHLERR